MSWNVKKPSRPPRAHPTHAPTRKSHILSMMPTWWLQEKEWFSLHPDASVTHHLEMIHYATMCWLRHLVDLFGTNYSHFRRFLQKKWSASQPQIYQEMIDWHYQSYLRLHCRLQRCYNPFRYWWFSNISYYHHETMIIDVFALESWKIWELFTSHHPLIPNRLDVSGNNQTLQGFTNRGETGENPFLQGFSLAKASSVSCGHPDSNGAVFLWCDSQWRWSPCYTMSMFTMLMGCLCLPCFAIFMFSMSHAHRVCKCMFCCKSSLMLVLNPRECTDTKCNACADVSILQSTYLWLSVCTLQLHHHNCKISNWFKTRMTFHCTDWFIGILIV